MDVGSRADDRVTEGRAALGTRHADDVGSEGGRTERFCSAIPGNHYIQGGIDGCKSMGAEGQKRPASTQLGKSAVSAASWTPS